MSYECESCYRRFATWRACKQHMDDVDHWPWACKTCTATFEAEWMVDEHMDCEDHWNHPFKCETCLASFQAEWMADEHMDDENHWSYPFECETCPYVFRTADARDDHQEDKGHYRHLHCADCNRYFPNNNNLRAHLNSRVHHGTDVACPFCAACFTTPSGVIHHLKRSSCPKARNLNSRAIHRAIRQRDAKGVITKRLLEWHEDDRQARWDPASAWNGYGYSCYLCKKVCNTPWSLQQHITSPAHQQKLYYCPNTGGRCGGKEFSTLAALFNHFKSESCGYTKFKTVQKNVNGFLTGRSQRLIRF